MPINVYLRPDPYSKKEMRTYIQEYLEEKGLYDAVREYDLKTVSINTLDITRTFLDKVMAVKRHAICGTLPGKVRHIYDVAILLERVEIKEFLEDRNRLKEILRKTKETDGFYLGKRGISEGYDPTGAYAFEDWRISFNDAIRARYETLQEDLLYTAEKQDFDRAISAFEAINQIFIEISE